MDVRKPGEYEADHIEDAQNFPLDFINQNMHQIDQNKTYYMHCRSGYRSTIAGSILKSRGVDYLVNVHGIFDDVVSSKIPTNSLTCSKS